MADDLSFDDLIPAGGADVAFDDLIPKQPGLADRYRGQFEQAKKMMAPAPATSVLDRASRASAADPMLRPEFIEEQRSIYGKMPEANRLPVLRRMAERDDVQGRAAKVLLAEAESVNATGRQAERDMPEFARVIAEGPRVAPPAGTGPRKPRPVSFPDAQPDITEIGAMPTEAQTLARRGAGGVLAAAAADPATLAERARVDATDWNQVEFARQNPIIAGAGTGGARALGGIINAPGTAAQFLAETLLNPISRRMGGDGFERVPNAPLVDGLMQAAQEWSSPQMTQEPMEAWDRDQFGTWLAANVAAQAPMFAQQVVAFMVPSARAMILPGMGAQVAGGEYAGGDSAVAAVGKGAFEAGSELISLGVMDKARSFFLKLPPGQRAAAVKDLAKRVGAASAAVTGSAAGEGGTEVLSQLGQNAIDQLSGKDTPLTSGLLASAIVGAVAGGGMMVPAAMMDLRRSTTDGSRMSPEDAMIQALETGQTRPAPPIIRVEDMPTTPLTPEQVAAIAPRPQVEPIPTGEATELPGLPADDGERIPVGQATEIAGPRAATPADLGVASVPQGSLAAMAEQQLRGRFVQPELPADAPLAVPAADAGRDQPGRSVGALGRMADDGRTGSVLPAEPVPAGRGGADQPAAAGDAPSGLKTEAPRLQNRDRSDAAYIQQMQAIGKNPDPDRLGVDRNMATGAPIVLADAVPAAQLGRVDRVVTAAGRKFPVQYAVVEAADLLPSNSADGTANAGYAEGLPGRARVVAGNGRAAGLQLAFTNGNAAGYVQGITADAGDHGVNPTTLAAMKQPVLVRIMQPADVTANIGDESNVSGVADKSAKEAARDDARRLDLGTLDFNDDGTLTTAALDAFVAAMPASEQTALRDSGGAPTKQAQDRLMAAVFQTAYDDDALLALYAQAIDPEARVVMAGLAAAAPQMMMLKDAGGLDIRPEITQAAKAAINAKRRGIKLADMAAQIDLAMDPNVAAVLTMFARNNRSAKRIGEELRAVAQFAYDQATQPAEDMFGPVPRAKRADVLGRLNEQGRPTNLEVPGRQQPVRGDLRAPAPDSAAEADGAGTEARGPAADQAAEDLAEAPTAEPFTTNGRALVYAAQNGIAGKVKPVEVTGGWALVPKERAPSVLTAEADATALDKANTALAKSGWKTPSGRPWKLRPAKNVPPIFKTVAAIIDAAFGVRVQAVNGAPGNGLQFGRGAFVDTARVTSPETLIGVTGHEVKHWFDANDKATGAKLDQAIEQHLKAGAVQAQMERENAQLVAGEVPMTEAGARLELLSDINGALWVDPDFWGRLYDLDSNAFRKVLYQFMRAATKFIKVAQGSTFDLTAYVDNVAAVRDAAAQAMVERAENRRGKAGPQMLVKNARRGRPSPLDQDLFAPPAPAAAGGNPQRAQFEGFDRVEVKTDAGWKQGTVKIASAREVTVQIDDGAEVTVSESRVFPVSPAPASAPTPAQADDFNLTAPTRGDVLAQQQARADETKAEAARRRARDEGERRDREQREIADRARQDASAENFMLGQDAEEALAGQGGLFNSRAGEWRLFPDTMGGKGIPRADMPQVSMVDRPAMLEFLSTERGTPSAKVEVPPGDLKPTQREYAPAKVDRSMEASGETATALVSSDGFVIDGHHRWLAQLRKGELLRAWRFDAPATEVIEAIRAFPGVRKSDESAGAEAVAGALPGQEGELILGGTAPPKDKPVVLVFGGSFNPIHSGHVQAAESARKMLTDAGYTVSTVLVSPSPQRLLAAKSGADASRLVDRTAMARRAFAGLDGFVVDDTPSRDADAFPGKLKRTQQADWVAAKYPGATVISLTGQDAAPGSPPGFPSLYQGDPGTSHDGYYYLAVPRDEASPDAISSSKIRKAIDAGQDVPSGFAAEDVLGYFKALRGKSGQTAIDGSLYDLDAPDFGLMKPQRPLPDDDPRLVPTAIENADKTLTFTRKMATLPDGTEVTRAALHKGIEDEHFAGVMAPTGRRPIVYVMGGGGAAGKGGVLRAMQGKNAIAQPGTAVHLDPDRIKGAIPEYAELIAAGDTRGASVVHEESSYLTKRIQPRAIAGKYDVILDVTLGDEAKALKVLKTFKDAGYEVRLFGVTIDPATATVRAIKRATEPGNDQGRWVPLDQLLKAHKAFTPAFAKYAEIADEAVLYDNTDGRTTLAEKVGGTLEIRDQKAYNEAVERSSRVDVQAQTLRGVREGAPRVVEPVGRSGGAGAQGVRAEGAREAGQQDTAQSQPGRRGSEGQDRGQAQGARPERGAGLPAVAQPAGAEYARLADPFAENYARLEGRKVSFDVRIEDTGQTATFTVDAAQYLRELDQRRDVARRLADCVAR